MHALCIQHDYDDFDIEKKGEKKKWIQSEKNYGTALVQETKILIHAYT